MNDDEGGADNNDSDEIFVLSNFWGVHNKRNRSRDVCGHLLNDIQKSNNYSTADS